MQFPVPLLPQSLRWFGAGLVAAVLFYFSVLTTVSSPPDPGPFWDKQLHFAGYAVFAYALAYATARSPINGRNRILLVLATSIAYGVAIEVVQAPLPERYFSYGDMLANAVGALLVLVWFAIESKVEYVPLGRGA